jgi:translocator protein
VLLAFTLFWIQLVLNALWSIIFFGKRSKGGGVITIIVLWFLILATMITSFRVSGWAGALLIPYILWVSIASYLNIGIWLLNKPNSQKNAV